MNVLVFNCGSSSLKYRLIDLPTETELAGGEAQRIGPPTAEPARIVHREGREDRTIVTPMADHREAFQKVMELLGRSESLRPDAVGHRLVHGGDVFDRHAVVNAENLRLLETLNPLAPLHNPPAVELIKACLHLYPDLPQVAVFDTAYHRTIPEYARTYPLPRSMREELGIRKFGFHGTSHHYVATEAAKFLGRPLDELNAVSCHLGSGGASLCAIVKGRSVDNTMGYSPLQGLLMSTRCGDLDPAVTMRLLSLHEGDCQSVEEALNKGSGVLGMSGASADIRDVLSGASGGGNAVRNAITSQLYLWRIRKYLGAYLAVVGTADAVIFTDTIGETVPEVRWSVCADMQCFGLRIDPRRNEAARDLPADVATDDSPVRILVIRTNEELAIARDTYAELTEAEGVLR